jgi:hypothetical protein
MKRIPYDLSKQLRMHKNFFSSTDMTMSIEKKKVMIIKSKNITYNTFIYDKNSLEEVPSYKYLGIDINHKLNWNYSLEKWINGWWKVCYGLEKNCKLANLWLWDKKKSSLRLSSLIFIVYGCEFWGCSISRES